MSQMGVLAKSEAVQYKGYLYKYVPDRERYAVVDPVAVVAAPVSWSLVNGEIWRGRLSD